MNKTSGRAILFQGLREKLFPVLQQHGFIGPELQQVAIDDRGIEPPPKALLYHFRQSMPSVGKIALTINVKSFSRPTFQIMAGNVPDEGVKVWTPFRIVPPEEVDATMLQVQGNIQAKPTRSYAPFRQPLLAYLLGSQRGIDDAVGHAIKLLPELINWLKTGTPSKNVRVLRSPRPE